MHVHTRMSSGQYSLPELTQIARTQEVDAIFLSDNLLTSIEFGLPPLRHIFYLRRRQAPSVLAFGAKRYLAEVQRENERQADVLYIPGVEIIPRFFWSGALLQTNLICHNHQRNLIVLGTYDPRTLAQLPLTSGYTPGRHSAWIIGTRLLLALFIAAGLATLILPRRLARQSGYTAGQIRRAFLLGLILPLFLLMAAINTAALMAPAFDIYSPDDPARFEQRALTALSARGSLPELGQGSASGGKSGKLLNFWAHPEAADHQEFRYLGVPFAVDTRPYPEVLLATKGWTGFAGVNEGENKFVDPGSVWDRVLQQHLAGQRDEPVWCFGERIYRAEGPGERLANVETVVWAPEKKPAALLESIRRGFFYARHNWAGQALQLDLWQVAGCASGQTGQLTNGAVNISLRVSAKIPGEKAEVLIIRNGIVIKKVTLTLPFELEINDAPPPTARKAYYRAARLSRHRRDSSLTLGMTVSACHVERSRDISTSVVYFWLPPNN
ncbi:MAG: hypothetical protein HYV35_02865 [Lentisphaerae bacterium]|nr:hypothetical protein [Lentisphaerota bacterium]